MVSGGDLDHLEFNKTGEIASILAGGNIDRVLQFQSLACFLLRSRSLTNMIGNKKDPLW